MKMMATVLIVLVVVGSVCVAQQPQARTDAYNWGMEAGTTMSNAGGVMDNCEAIFQQLEQLKQMHDGYGGNTRMNAIVLNANNLMNDAAEVHEGHNTLFTVDFALGGQYFEQGDQLYAQGDEAGAIAKWTQAGVKWYEADFDHADPAYTDAKFAESQLMDMLTEALAL